MAQWNFYFSGILYGKIYEENDGLYIERLIPETGAMTEKNLYSEEDERFLANLSKRSMRGFFEHKEEYEKFISEGVEGFVTADGEEFTNRRKESYYQRHKKFPKDLFYENQEIFAVQMTGRDYTSVLVKDGFEEKTVIAEWKKVYPEQSPVFAVNFLGTFSVLTRDGEKLATDVYLPAGSKETKFPTVFVRTPYGKGVGAESYYRFVQHGYAVVIQDTRGREDSTGEWMPQYYEVEDGDDTLNWIADQEWSDGQVGMTGGSYLGYVQWAAAASGNPHLKAMLSGVCAGSAFVDFPRRGGCFSSGTLAWAFMMSEQRMREDLMDQDNWDEILDVRPIKKVPEKALGHEIKFLTEWLKHKDLDDFWKMSSWKDRYQGQPVPALIMSGWFDDNGMGTTEALDLVKDWPEGTWKTILGPWKHSGNADYDIHNVYMGEDALRYDIDIVCMMWLEHFLKGVENGIEKTPTAEYFTVGENKWKTAEEWPPEFTKEETYYLREGNELAMEAGVQESTDSYIYNPENPSTHIIDMSENEIEVPEDYTEEEKREDILVYSTPVLTEPLTITGDAMVKLYVSCDCPDTDLMVRITDVDENGKSIKIADGIKSVKYRNGYESQEYMEPGKVYEVCIRTTKISNKFNPGHQMRFTVTSSAKNFMFPTSNTENGFDSEEKQKANVTIHHGGKYASYIQVPVEK